jgi:hypothetical protein
MRHTRVNLVTLGSTPLIPMIQSSLPYRLTVYLCIA